MKKFIYLIIVFVFLSSCSQKDNVDLNGFIHENEYINNYFSFNLALEGDWQFLTDEQISKLTGYERADLETEGKLVDMMAIKLDNKDNIQVYFEELGERKKSFLNKETAVNLVKEVNINNKNLKIDENIKKEKISSKEYYIVKSQSIDNSFYKDYLIRIEGDYIFIFSITYKDSSDFDKIVSMIK